jgi:hypothetical protein
MRSLVEQLRELEPSTSLSEDAADRIEQLEAALREVEDALGYVKNEGKTLAIRESNAHSAWKIARAALAPETGK